jgi:hypothetical protein
MSRHLQPKSRTAARGVGGMRVGVHRPPFDLLKNRKT